MKKISVLFSLLVNTIMSVILAAVTGFNPLAVFGVVFALMCLPSGAVGFGAKIILTDFIGDIWGKVGATVYKKNFYGLSRIMKVNPKNPQSEKQMANRGDFGDLYSVFLSLSTDQFNAWAQLARSTPYLKKGRSYFLDTLPFFVKCNRNLQIIGESPISDVPDWNVIPQSFDGFSVDIVTKPGSEKININFDPPILPMTKLKLYATPPLGNRQNSVNNRYRLIKILDHTFESGYDIRSDYIATFGSAPATGKKAFFAIEPVVITSGRSGARLTTSDVGTDLQ